MPAEAWARDRCLHPGTQRCPATPGLLSVRRVGDVPFHYPHAIRRSAGGVAVITKRDETRQQRYLPLVQIALTTFLTNMRRFGMPVEAIITYGSLYCRCISRTDKLSDHSYGDAIDVVGVRWPATGGPPSTTRDTIVHNYLVPDQRRLLRRIDACLRLSFDRVIDYHRSDHHDHFHCDLNQGRGPRPRERVSLTFAQEALGVALGRPVPVTGRLDAATQRALRDFSGTVPPDDRALLAVLRTLHTRIAAGSLVPSS